VTNLDVIINGDSGVVPKGAPDESADQVACGAGREGSRTTTNTTVGGQNG